MDLAWVHQGRPPKKKYWFEGMFPAVFLSIFLTLGVVMNFESIWLGPLTGQLSLVILLGILWPMCAQSFGSYRGQKYDKAKKKFVTDHPDEYQLLFGKQTR